MNNPTIDNDLQRAIDDITKNTNSDPVFADPVAAPAPTTPVTPVAPMPQSTHTNVARPINNFSRSSLNTATQKPQTFINEPVAGPISEPTPTFEPPVTFAPAPAPAPMSMPNQAPIAEPVASSTYSETVMMTPEFVTPTPEAVSVSESITETENSATPTEFDEIKRAALRDLSKVIDKLDVSPTQKFDVYRKVHDDFGDSSVIAPAYKAATEIKDDKERGEALLYLVNSLDN